MTLHSRGPSNPFAGILQPLVLLGLGLESADEIKQKAQKLASERLQVAKDVGGHFVEETTKVARQELTQVFGGEEQGHADGQNEQGGLAHDNEFHGQSDQQNSDPAHNQQGGSDFNRIDSGPNH